jgi:hypothetical protein
MRIKIIMETPDGDMLGYPLRHVIEQGLDLDQFDDCDWIYDANFDMVFVRHKSKIAVFLALCFGDLAH